MEEITLFTRKHERTKTCLDTQTHLLTVSKQLLCTALQDCSSIIGAVKVFINKEIIKTP